MATLVFKSKWNSLFILLPETYLGFFNSDKPTLDRHEKIGNHLYTCQLAAVKSKEYSIFFKATKYQKLLKQLKQKTNKQTTKKTKQKRQQPNKENNNNKQANQRKLA